MASSSPSLAWDPFFEGGNGISASGSASDLFWAKQNEETSFSALDSFNAQSGALRDDGEGLSSASSQADSDAFPVSSMHHLPAWSTVGKLHNKTSNTVLADVDGAVTHISPGDAFSASGLSDRDGDDGLNDDLWFIPSPTSGQADGVSAGLHRKKRMHFAHEGPRTIDASSPGASLPSTLKTFKSTPNLQRRVSSAYVNKLEELMMEMGWPKQDAKGKADTSGGEEAEDGAGDTTQRGLQGAEAGNDTIQASSGWLGDAGDRDQMTSSSSGGIQQASAYGSLPSGLPSSTTGGALYQRRANSRDGNLPVPEPVLVPGQIVADSASFAHSALSSGNSALTAVAESSAHQQRAAALLAQQYRLQQMASSLNGMGTANTLSQTTSLLEESPAISGVQGIPLSFTGSTGSLGTSPALRPDTASSGSVGGELRTPITPFVNLSLTPGSATLPNATSHVTGAIPTAWPSTLGASLNEVTLSQFNKFQAASNLPGMQHDYLASLQNSLGLFDGTMGPLADGGVGPTVPPTMLENRHSYSHPMQPNGALGLTNVPNMAEYESIALPPQHTPQRLVFPPQQQKVMPVGRPRAGTAMASLGGTLKSPRHMRSTPNLQMSPSPSLDGSAHPAGGGSASVTNTPIRSIRKIASNRRLTMLTATPESPSVQLFPTSSSTATMPASPMSPTKRNRALPMGGMLTTSTSFSGSTNGGGGFEFINYGINDADELCSAVAPSGSYKVPLKGYGGSGGEDDDDEDGFDGFGEDDEGSDTRSVQRSPRRAASARDLSRKARQSINRNGPRWEDPDAPPVPTLTNGTTDKLLQAMNTASATATVEAEAGARQIKRRKSDANMMLSGRRKSPSMSNLRK